MRESFQLRGTPTTPPTMGWVGFGLGGRVVTILDLEVGLEVGTQASATLLPAGVPSMGFAGDGWSRFQRTSQIKKIRFAKLFSKKLDAFLVAYCRH